MVQIKHVLQWIDSLAPFRFAESWDNCGLQVGNPEACVSKIMVALDPGSTVIKEAEELGCQCVVTHHPLLFQPIRVVRTDAWPGSVIALALASGISLIAAHTNLDAASRGTNAQLVRLLGLGDANPLAPPDGFAGDERFSGIGLTGDLPETMRLDLLVSHLQNGLPGTDIRFVGPPEKEVRRVSVCSGSGGSLIGKVAAGGADVFVTGDIRYHDAKLAEEIGLALVDIGHFASEKLILEPLASFLGSCAPAGEDGVRIFVAKSERNPFRMIAV